MGGNGLGGRSGGHVNHWCRRLIANRKTFRQPRDEHCQLSPTSHHQLHSVALERRRLALLRHQNVPR